jgi:hypothetical protein
LMKPCCVRPDIFLATKARCHKENQAQSQKLKTFVSQRPKILQITAQTPSPHLALWQSVRKMVLDLVHDGLLLAGQEICRPG